MNRISGLFFAAIITLPMVGAASAAPLPGRARLTENNVVEVQYGGGNCSNWHRQCARLYGQGSPNWNACMNQPQARYDCGGGGGYGGGYSGGYGGGYGQDLCGNWQRQCSRLYGRRTYNFQACMNQPQALEDCERY